MIDAFRCNQYQLRNQQNEYEPILLPSKLSRLARRRPWPTCPWRRWQPTHAAPQVNGPGGNSASDADVLLNLFQKKGLISDQDVKDAHEALAARTNSRAPEAAASMWKIANTFEKVQLYGDVRFRYEYRGVDNAPGAMPNNFYRERFRYAVRVGLRGDLTDDFNFGVRLETSNNPRSPWDTFGNNTTAGSVTPFGQQFELDLSRAGLPRLASHELV